MIDVRLCMSRRHDVKLAVSSSGLVITVHGGAFTILDTEYVLEEDWTYTVNTDVRKWAVGHLMVDEGGSVSLGVQEWEEDFPLKFDWEGSPYRSLHQLFVVPDVLSGAITLDDVQIRVTHIGAPEA